MQSKKSSIFNLTVLVASLGYLVDIYDLLLFGIIRVKSLTALGLNATEVGKQGKSIIGIQMFGLLIGGIIWGIMGDKKGRKSVLFGSIILYSLANIANGFVHNVVQYSIVRFIAGLGLAGELGAGITLVSELLPKEKRGLGTALVSGVGVLGAVAAFLVSEEFEWRTCYFIGGGLGLVLLIMRISVFESGMYHEVKKMNVSKGNFLKFFINGKRFRKYIASILIGLPTWYIIGVLITFSNEFGKEFGIVQPIDAGRAIMYSYMAISVGNFLIGVLSQVMKSRKKALYVFYLITIIFAVAFFRQDASSTDSGMYWICAGMGLGAGFWAIFVTIAAEQFGINLRATAAITVPNMVRGALPLILALFQWLTVPFGYLRGGWITGIIVMVLTLIGAAMVEETFGKDLDYVEQ